jgi:hypothetical protein
MIGVMSWSRRKFLVAAGFGAAMSVIGVGCSGSSSDPTAATASGAGVLDGVRARVRRDPG